jgi:hypothetical protein
MAKDARAWVPKTIPATGRNLLIRLTKLFVPKSRLVWVRDAWDNKWLCVAFPSAYDEFGLPLFSAYRYWPFYLRMTLNSDGSVSTGRDDNYIYHWIEAAPAAQTVMMLKNYDTYASFVRDESQDPPVYIGGGGVTTI